ncbi:uncharacterized protein LOC133194734 [Saccostrea echinata]|uniref:uncharacterized protein LOC133194734 n=1 Tax=Saccostrea echinata TaxID=191078 RepID=UPI002A80C56E|nr:uncharacterized protein LOC133194734 [Saccostrea echinata]
MASNMEWCMLFVWLCLGFCASQDTSPMTETAPTPEMSPPDLLPLIVPTVVTVLCTIIIIVVIILYLRFCHQTGGDKVSDAETGKKTDKKTDKPSSRFEMALLSTASTDREAESVLNGAKEQLREIKSLEKNLALSVKEFKSLMWHASSVLKLIDEGIDEENEPKNLKDELFEEVNKRVAKDPKDKPDEEEDESKVRRIESVREKQNRLFTETIKVLNEGKKHIKEANQKDIEIRNFTKDGKKALSQVKDRVREMRKSSGADKKKDGKHGKFGTGEEKKPLLDQKK